MFVPSYPSYPSSYPAYPAYPAYPPNPAYSPNPPNPSRVEAPLPQNLAVNLAFTLALFIVGLVGVRYVIRDQWGVDLFDFSKTYTKVGAGVVGCVILFTLFETIASPKGARALGRKLVGRDYNAQVVRTQLAASQDAQAQINELARLQPSLPTLTRVPV